MRSAPPNPPGAADSLLAFGSALAPDPPPVRRAEWMNVPGKGRFPWQRLLGSLLGALLLAMAGFVALWAHTMEPRPIDVAIETITLPVVRVVHLVGGRRGEQRIWFAVLSSIVTWWVILFALLTMRASKRDARRPA